MTHDLIIEHREGCYEAHCSCGRWRKEPVTRSATRVCEVYPRLQVEHRKHIGEVETEEVDLNHGSSRS